MMRPCLGFNGSCPDGALTTRSRCRGCESRYQAARNRRPERAIYKGNWRATSKAARAEQPFCVVCGTDKDTTTDHTTGLTVCRRHHHTEAHGGIFRAIGVTR